MQVLSGAVVLIVGLFLLTQAGVAIVSPTAVRRFLGGFASTPLAHYLELALRAIAGGAFVHYAPRMEHSPLFHVFGVILLGTTAVMFLLPWHWHTRFARWVVPRATRRMKTFALGCAIGGSFIVYAFAAGRGYGIG